MKKRVCHSCAKQQNYEGIVIGCQHFDPGPDEDCNNWVDYEEQAEKDNEEYIETARRC